MTKSRTGIDPKRRAHAVLQELQITHGPVAVDYVAQRKGITVRFVPLEQDMSGMIFKKETPIIVVNSLHHPNRQRFTLAHEVGHFELHMQEIGTEVHVDKQFLAYARDTKSSLGSDRREIEANRFAAELLVPRHFLVTALAGRIVDVENEELISELATNFEVSRQMMAFRIAELAESKFSE